MNTEISKLVNKVSTADVIAGKETKAVFLGRLKEAVLNEVQLTLEGYRSLVLNEHKLTEADDILSAFWATREVYNELAEVLELASEKAMKVHDTLADELEAQWVQEQTKTAQNV